MAFVSVDAAHREAAVKFYEHVRDHDTESCAIAKGLPKLIDSKIMFR